MSLLSGGDISEQLLSLHAVSSVTMTTEQTQSNDEDLVMQLRATVEAGRWTLPWIVLFNL